MIFGQRLSYVALDCFSFAARKKQRQLMKYFVCCSEKVQRLTKMFFSLLEKSALAHDKKLLFRVTRKKMRLTKNVCFVPLEKEEEDSDVLLLRRGAQIGYCWQ